MAETGYDGTVTSKLKPIVTMLTEALVKDFAPAYEYMPEVSRVAGRPMWERGDAVIVDANGLRKDVEAWLLGLEHDMAEESDRKYAQMVAHMIRKNNGWVTLLTNRVLKRITPSE